MLSRTMGECAVRIRISAISSAMVSKAFFSTSSRIESIMVGAAGIPVSGMAIPPAR